MVKKFIYPLVMIAVIMTIFIMINKDLSQDSYFIPIELLDPTNLERVEILDIDSNESIILTQKSDFEELISFLNVLNTEGSFGTYDSEDKVSHLLYISEIGHYPPGPISIAKNAIINGDKMMNLSSEISTQLHSILLGTSQ